MPGWGGCDVCLTGSEQIKGGFTTTTNLVRRLQLPQSFKPEDVQKARRDCEILSAKLQTNPEQMSALLAAALRNDITSAKQIARQIGFTEQEFAKQGGGLMWLVVIGVLLYATDAY